MLRKKTLVTILAVGFLLAGCTAAPAGITPAAGMNDQPPSSTATLAAAPTETLPPTLTPLPETAPLIGTPTATPIDLPVSCALTPISVPTRGPNPGANKLDETTGLHMTGIPVRIDLADYRFKVTGLVDRPLSLSLEALRCMPKVTATPTLTCPGYFVDKASWSGVPIKYVLELAGLQSSAQSLALVSADKYVTRMGLQTALKEENFLAYEWEGQPLPVLHGFPLRAVFPSLQGNFWVKWLVEIRVE